MNQYQRAIVLMFVVVGVLLFGPVLYMAVIL